MNALRTDDHGKHKTGDCFLRDEERQRCEVWTRVMGYHRPVSSFNIGKKAEFKERVYFRECIAIAISNVATSSRH